MTEPLTDAWNLNNRIHLYLLDAISPDGLKGVPVGMSGRSVGEIFAHMHNVRLMWLEVSAPNLFETVAKIPAKSKADKAAITHELLRASLDASGQAMAALFEDSLPTGKVKNYKPHLMTFYSYFISHEGYHRGEICMTLTQAGHKLPDEILYGIWEWEKR